MLLRAAQKCFEWLLCRFHIADVQAEDVLLAMLPYHDTNLFTKISCQVKLPQNWRWLKTFKHEVNKKQSGKHFSSPIFFYKVANPVSPAKKY
jgi:hypothetical protein